MIYCKSQNRVEDPAYLHILGEKIFYFSVDNIYNKFEIYGISWLLRSLSDSWEVFSWEMQDKAKRTYELHKKFIDVFRNQG